MNLHWNEEPPAMALGDAFHPDDARFFDGAREVAESRVYNWYAAYGERLGPVAMLEVGVRRGYGALSIARGAGGRLRRYLGLDAELDLPGGNAAAAAAIRAAGVPEVSVLKVNTRHGFPALAGGFDLVHVDADHSMAGALGDMRGAAPLLVPGGHLILDDVDNVRVCCALAAVLATGGPRLLAVGGLRIRQAILAPGDGISADTPPEFALPLRLDAAREALDERPAGIAALFEAAGLALGLAAERQWPACPVAALARLAALAPDAEWLAEARPHARYAAARLADAPAAPVFGNVTRLPDAFQPGTAGHAAMRLEAARNFGDILARAAALHCLQRLPAALAAPLRAAGLPVGG